MPGHIILLGDSIFDNAAYTRGGPAVIDQLRDQLAEGWRATLLAVDGAMTADVTQQLACLPPDATHLILSIGGNDALDASGFVSAPASSVGAVLQQMYDIEARFAATYAATLDAVLARRLPTAVCLVYDPNFPDPATQAAMTMGLQLFNDAILRAAVRRGLPVLDLRHICTTPQDFANEIEPSSAGAAKIACAITQMLDAHDFAAGRTTIYALASGGL
jgi:lysophospholipase L1-like esterase